MTKDRNLNPNAKLNARQAAVYLNVSVSTLKRWRSRHYGPAWYQMTDSSNCPVLYRVADLDAWVRTRREAR